MKNFQPTEIRNVALVGHGSAGKTSIAEAILYLTGVSDRLGKVGDTSSIMDYDPEEIKRGNSINASVAFCEWEKTKINILDTPGSNNFIGDTPACIRVVDGVLVVIGADDGIQYFTEKVWQWATEASLPKIIFINKMDSDKAAVGPILEGIKKKFKATPVFLQLPSGTGENFEGIADIAGQSFYTYDKDGKGNGAQGDLPDNLKDEAAAARESLVENVAEPDDELIEKYLEAGELSEEEFAQGLKKGVESGDLIPVFCGSATENIGIDLLLNAIVEYLPSPERLTVVEGASVKDDSKVSFDANEKSLLSSLIFKTVADTYAGKLTLFRVFSGVIKPDSSVYNEDNCLPCRGKNRFPSRRWRLGTSVLWPNSSPVSQATLLPFRIRA